MLDILPSTQQMVALKNSKSRFLDLTNFELTEGAKIINLKIFFDELSCE